MNQEKPVVLIVEDSIFAAREHQKHLADLGANPIILRATGKLEETINQISKTEIIKAIIADGLHGDWMAAALIATKAGIPLWLITGNDDYIRDARSFPNTKTLSKVHLSKNPENYRRIIAG